VGWFVTSGGTTRFKTKRGVAFDGDASIINPTCLPTSLAFTPVSVHALLINYYKSVSTSLSFVGPDFFSFGLSRQATPIDKSIFGGCATEQCFLGSFNNPYTC
jgi:hypothetical protein